MTCGCAEYCLLYFVNIERNGEIETEAWRLQASQSLFHRLGKVGANRSSHIASGMRNYLKQYFISEIGQQQVPWQNENTLYGYFINLPK